MRNVIVYHRGCPDGWGAAWWLRKMLLLRGDGVGDAVNVELVSANWGDKVDKGWDDAHVWCVDYCFEADGLRWLTDNARRLDVIDHHQSSLGYITDAGQKPFTEWQHYCDMGELGGLDKSAYVLDQRHSGVGLVARIMKRWHGAEPPLFVWNLEDRDLWRFEMSATRDVFAAVTARPYTIEAWDEMERMDFDTLVAEGEGINMYRDQLIESVATSTFYITLGGDGDGWYFQCASSPYFIGSDVAGLIAERHEAAGGKGYGAYCILHDDRVQIGLRSRGDFDVAKIAEFHGGGGHKNASGLTLSWKEFNDRVWVGLGAELASSVAATDERHRA